MENLKIEIGDVVSYLSFGNKIEAKVLDKKENGYGTSKDEKLLLDITGSSLCRSKTWVKTKKVKLIKKAE